MTEARKPQKQHPSTAIPVKTIEELAYRVYLARLEPPMTVEQSQERVERSVDRRGEEIVEDDASRRHLSKAYLPLTRVFLRALVDMGLVVVTPGPPESEPRADDGPIMTVAPDLRGRRDIGVIREPDESDEEYRSRCELLALLLKHAEEPPADEAQ